MDVITPVRCFAAATLGLLCGCHPSRVAPGLLECFPDSAGTRRTFELTRPQGGVSRFLVETRVADRRLPGRLGLDFVDPVHETTLGNYQLIVQDTLLEMVLPNANLRLPLLQGALAPDPDWKRPLAGFESRKIGWETLTGASGASLLAFGCEYRVSPGLLEQAGVAGVNTAWEMELWLVPGLGPVRIEANGNYREELVP
jgi:hypothetical protein